MHFLTSLFPQDDYSLIGLILGMPLLGAFVNGVWGKRLGKPAVRLMALTAIGISFIACVASFLVLDALDSHGGHGGGPTRLVWNVWDWMHTSGMNEASVPIAVRFSIDPLSGVMMLVVTGVGFLIHLYSTAYMADDAGFARFFAYLNLFVFSMLILILGDNLPLLFVGWEGVGLCSYLLIGFWYQHAPNAAAGKKAFIANRIGDFGLLCAMFLLAYYCGSLDWIGIQSHAAELLRPDPASQVHLWPLGGGEYKDIMLGALKLPLHWLQPDKPFTISIATAVGLALLLGCTGKSAQIPLYVWLPDAMAGPTPVSALIHAATMVTAGIYLICRMSAVFVLSPFVMATIATIGALTALFAATIALVQNDIKKVLAYSTVSQLGFMFLGVGVGAFTAGFFHVFTHAFFKACLFLGAGSVIHAMHARIHDGDKSQDIRHMGGLRKYMPLTYYTFAAATLAIIGFPLTSGFFSKDEILYRAYTNMIAVPPSVGKTLDMWEWKPWLGPALYWIGVVTATLTAFYMCRVFFLTFFGDFRGWTIGRPSMISSPQHDAHGHDDHGHHEDDLTKPGYPPHESPRPMTLPLIILACFSIFAGILNPGFHIFEKVFHKEAPPLEHFFHPLFAGATAQVRQNEASEFTLAIPGILAFLIGSGVAYWVYVAQRGEPARKLAASVPRLYRLVLDKWRIDELYEATILGAVDSLAETAAAMDRAVVDGLFARATALIVSIFGNILRAFQNGVVHAYAAMMVIGTAGVGYFFVKPHADFVHMETAKEERDSGDYTIIAGPGMGYAYRWDADGDGKFDTEDYPGPAQVRVHLDPGASKRILLEVRNAFGLKATRAIDLSRPANEPMKVGQK